MSKLRGKIEIGGKSWGRTFLPPQVIADCRTSNAVQKEYALKKMGLIKMKDFRLLIFMEKPERGDFHFASIVWGGSV
jgi:hypothetical protein